MAAYYNEIDPFAAQWLRELIKTGQIAPGDVDERSIEDVCPDDLRPYTQCHFFAGIGVWSYALRQAGWPDDRPVWTGSCPCQPFSAAGKGGGFEDERHLWPAWDWLIEFGEPPVILGEQVASKDAEPWLDLVQADLEDMGYAFGAVAFPSASVGAPHIRDRTYWVADTLSAGRAKGRTGAGHRPVAGSGGAERLVDAIGERGRGGQLGRENAADAGLPGEASGLGHSERLGAGRHAGAGLGAEGRHGGRHVGDDARPSGTVLGVADADRGQRQGQPVLRGPERNGQDTGRAEGGGSTPARREDARVRGDGRGLQDGAGAEGEHGLREVALRPGPVNGLWRAADWLYCRDGSWRSVEPELEPLAHGAPARVGRLRGYGNAINAQQAQIFIEAYLESGVA